MFSSLLRALKATGAVFDAIGRVAEWFREWQARRAAEEAGGLKERARARVAAETVERAANDAGDKAAVGDPDAPDEFMRKP